MTDENPPRAEEMQHPAFVAGLNLISRTGAGRFQLRCSVEDEPPVWLSVVQFANSPVNAAGLSSNGSTVPDVFYETASGLGPLESVMRLCDQVLAGSTCGHCERPILFQIFQTTNIETLTDSLDPEFCVMAWSPLAEQFQPACQRGD